MKKRNIGKELIERLKEAINFYKKKTNNERRNKRSRKKRVRKSNRDA